MTGFIELTLFSLLASGMTPKAWYAVPLILAISLVYGATRHEFLSEIFAHAVRSVVWIVGFMLVIFAIIWVVGYGN